CIEVEEPTGNDVDVKTDLGGRTVGAGEFELVSLQRTPSTLTGEDRVVDSSAEVRAHVAVGIDVILQAERRWQKLRLCDFTGALQSDSVQEGQPAEKFYAPLRREHVGSRECQTGRAFNIDRKSV